MIIPEEKIQEIKDKIDIVDLVSEYVTLKPKGGQYWGLCPFHDEKTPSFSVTPSKEICWCFGCQKGGGAINFIMEIEKLGFVDAVQMLAKKAGIDNINTNKIPPFKKTCNGPKCIIFTPPI